MRGLELALLLIRFCPDAEVLTADPEEGPYLHKSIVVRLSTDKEYVLVSGQDLVLRPESEAIAAGLRAGKELTE
jgi:hypothetical protein